MASLRVQRNPLYNRWQIRLTRLRKLPCAEVTKGYILKHSLHTGRSGEFCQAWTPHQSTTACPKVALRLLNGILGDTPTAP